MFGRDEYYISFLGQPSVTEPWMIQFGGHHLGLNMTLLGEQGTLAPSHTAAQPAIYELEGKTVRPSAARLRKALLSSALSTKRSARRPFLPTRYETWCLARGGMDRRSSRKESRAPT